jgi:hypothetical protein
MPPKWLAFYGLLAITAPFAYVVYQGWAYRTTKDSLQLEHHRDATNFALWYTVLGIVLIRISTQLSVPAPYPAIFWVHLPLAATFFVLLLVLRFWLTGLRSTHHRLLGRLCAAFFAGTLGTGAVLIWQM